MEIDLYTDLVAFNALTPEEQEEEAERLRVELAAEEAERLQVELAAEDAPSEPPPLEDFAPAPQWPPATPPPPPKQPTRQPMARVMVAPAAAFAGQTMADTPGSVILRAEDILPEEDEPELAPAPEPKVELKAPPVDESIPEPVSKSMPEPVGTLPESMGRKAKMDDQQRVSGPLMDLGVPTSKSDSGLIVCPVCNSRSNPQDLFCVGCGSFLTEPDEPEVELAAAPSCSDCGAAVEPGEIFCPSCGSALPS